MKEPEKCPLCGGGAFTERYWVSLITGAQLRLKRPFGKPLKDSLRWFVCEDCGHVLTFYAG